LLAKGMHSISDLVTLFKKFDLSGDGTLQRSEI
jgi:hypothetical protein